jgi:PhnB protein
VTVKPIPDGYHSVTPYLMVQGAAELIDFLTQAFGARETLRMPRPDGTIGHAEVMIGDSVVMMGDVVAGSQTMPGAIHLYVDDADAAYARAMGAGATSLREPTDEFYGDRMAGVKDPVGNQWWIATHQEDVPPEEMEARAGAATEPQG